MITSEHVQKPQIRAHYELATVFYHLLWGPHIHHGLWTAEESPRTAQRNLIEHLLKISGIQNGSAILDIGCGMGGSSIYLSKEKDCQVTGVTLSSLQRTWAATSARMQGVGQRTRFIRGDAELVSFPEASFDWLWSIECTEHLFDKPAFFRRSAQWLNDQGGMALCVWHAGDEPHSPQTIEQARAVCDAFLCPSLGTVADYERWLADAGLSIHCVNDLTSQITRTWEICQRRIQRAGIRPLARLAGRNMTEFVESFQTILEAYRSGAMKYCSIVARKVGH